MGPELSRADLPGSLLFRAEDLGGGGAAPSIGPRALETLAMPLQETYSILAFLGLFSQKEPHHRDTMPCSCIICDFLKPRYTKQFVTCNSC